MPTISIESSYWRLTSIDYTRAKFPLSKTVAQLHETYMALLGRGSLRWVAMYHFLHDGPEKFKTGTSDFLGDINQPLDPFLPT